MVSDDVNTVTSLRSRRAASACATAVVVVPTSRITVSPGWTSAAAATAMARFWSGASISDSSNGRSICAAARGTAPPRTRRSAPRRSNTSRSERTVTSETSKRWASSLTRTNSRSRSTASIRSRRTRAGGGSPFIAAGLPRIAHDVVEVGVRGHPAQLLARPLRGGDQHRWVAGTTRNLVGGDRVAGDPPSRLDHLPDAEPGGVAEVAGQRAVVVEPFDRPHVRVGEVRHVDVVADRGAVGGGVVGAVHRDAVALTAGDLQHQRDQVGLGVVALGPSGRGTGGVEVAQGGGAQPVDPV